MLLADHPRPDAADPLAFLTAAVVADDPADLKSVSVVNDPNGVHACAAHGSLNLCGQTGSLHLILSFDVTGLADHTDMIKAVRAYPLGELVSKVYDAGEVLVARVGSCFSGVHRDDQTHDSNAHHDQHKKDCQPRVLWLEVLISRCCRGGKQQRGNDDLFQSILPNLRPAVPTLEEHRNGAK